MTNKTQSKPFCCCWSLLYSVYCPLSSRLTALACDSAWVTSFFIARVWISTKVVYLQHWHGWCHMNCCHLGAFCVHHTTWHFMQSHIHKVHACLAVTCHLHFWRNDWGLLCATAVTQGWNGYQDKSQHRRLTLEKKILPPLLQGFKPVTFQPWVRCSNHWAIPTPHLTYETLIASTKHFLFFITASSKPIAGQKQGQNVEWMMFSKVSCMITFQCSK